ncbi:type 1 glutamine amidotransferase domain-containing protein [Deinococcus lacus]|uniref:Type 1 glutamine amidotransferase domain-containing protein n=1 Tax=Deinococcus lacus TaxID=392561 RepID=A0ABW1YF30_9DEIO
MSKVLAVVTSHPVYDGHDTPTGLWLSELTHFFDRLVKAGHEVDIASIAGGPVPIDPVSLSKMNMDAETQGYYDDPRFMKLLNESLALKDLDPADYDAIYFAGGHGTLYDFRHKPEIERAILDIDARGGIVSAVCHGPAALLDVQKGGQPFIAGKQVTGFAALEERLAMRMDKVPFVLEDAMKELSEGYGKGLLPFVPHVVVDGRLVTGQNPQSAKGVAEKVIEALAGA